MRKNQDGFNLLEMMTTVAVAVTGLTVGVPSINNTLERRSISAAAEQVYNFTQMARTESIKRNRSVFVSFRNDDQNNWCVGLAENDDCDCQTAGACQLDGRDQIVSSLDFAGVAINQNFADGHTGFDARRGLAIDAGKAVLSTTDYEVDVAISVLGQVSMCTPASAPALSGVSQC